MDLRAKGLTDPSFRDTLAAYCVAWDHWRTALEHLGDKKNLVQKTQSGYGQVGPWTTVLKQTSEQMRQLGDRLGLSPSALTRLYHKPDDGDKDDPVKATVNRRKGRRQGLSAADG